MSISSRNNITKHSIAKAFLKEAKEQGFLESKDFFKFKNTSEKDLIDYHHSIGRNIRNYYSLWDPENPLTSNWHNHPESRTMVAGVDHSDDHPDVVSMDIVRLIWQEVNDES